MNTVLNQNVKVTKRARFATFAMSIVSNLCLLQQYKWNKTKQNKIRLHAAINLQRAIRIKFPDHS